VGFGIAEHHYYRNFHISLENPYQTNIRDFRVINLLEKHLNLLQTRGFAPLGVSQQYESQQFIADNIFYVEGCWRCHFFFCVEASQRVLQDELLTWRSEPVLCVSPERNKSDPSTAHLPGHFS